MTKFTASNGVTVEQFTGSLNVQDGTESEWVRPRLAEALGEFFRAKRDADLGRWRWPEYPDYVVYPDGTSRRVVRESDGRSLSVSLHERKVMTTYWDSYVGAARAYDDAHPEPKPWHDAKPGEAWMLTVDNDDDDVEVTVIDCGDGQGFEFINSRRRFSVEYVSITTGCRIWPED